MENKKRKRDQMPMISSVPMLHPMLHATHGMQPMQPIYTLAKCNECDKPTRWALANQHARYSDCSYETPLCLECNFPIFSISSSSSPLGDQHHCYRILFPNTWDKVNEK